MVEFVAGVLVGGCVPVSIAVYGAHSLKKHPEVLMKYMSRKMVREIRKARKTDELQP